MGGDCGAPHGATTAAQQEALERAVASIYGDPPRELALLRAPHAQYLLAGLRHLSPGHCGKRSPLAGGRDRIAAAAAQPVHPPALTRPRPRRRTAALDAGRPWLVFWITHSLALLEVPLPEGAPGVRAAALLLPLPSALSGLTRRAHVQVIVRTRSPSWRAAARPAAASVAAPGSRRTWRRRMPRARRCARSAARTRSPRWTGPRCCASCCA
jgi:hypothetical protein